MVSINGMQKYEIPTKCKANTHTYFEEKEAAASFLFISANTPQVRGMAQRNVNRSDVAWQASTPSNPKKWGRMKMRGIKNNPWRADDRTVARTGFRMVCNIMLLTIIHAPKGKVMNCHRKAAAPTAITAGSSLRKSATISSAYPIPATAQTSRKIKPIGNTSVQNSYC